MSPYHFGLLGYPLEHSLSPLLHRSAFDLLGLRGSYALFPIAPSSDAGGQMEILLSRLRKRELHGLNVTIPYKTAVLPYVDVLSTAAKAIGAVNAISLKDSRLSGDNFDCPAFLEDLRHQMGELGEFSRPMDGRRALVLGAGGAARAVVYGLLGQGWKVCVAARRRAAAEGIARAFAEFVGLSTCTMDRISWQDAQQLDLIVNASPVGMYPDLSSSPWPEDVALPRKGWLYDLVYNPAETCLMRQARRAGLAAANGLGMLARQAALSFSAWTGCLPDWRDMLEALQRERTAS